jgi:hypothetical protein
VIFAVIAAAVAELVPFVIVGELALCLTTAEAVGAAVVAA